MPSFSAASNNSSMPFYKNLPVFIRSNLKTIIKILFLFIKFPLMLFLTLFTNGQKKQQNKEKSKLFNFSAIVMRPNERFFGVNQKKL